MEQGFELVDCCRNSSGERRLPLKGAFAQRTPDPLHAAGQIGKWRNLRHRCRPAQRARDAVEGVGVRSGISTTVEQTVELLDVLTRLEDEELQEPGRRTHVRSIA